MSEYIKSWLTVLFLFISVTLFTGILSAAMETSAARDYHSTVIAEIENSNFNDSVISACEKEAEEQGYELSVNRIVTDADADKQIADVILKYQFKVGLLHMNDSRQIRGTAR